MSLFVAGGRLIASSCNTKYVLAPYYLACDWMTVIGRAISLYIKVSLHSMPHSCFRRWISAWTDVHIEYPTYFLNRCVDIILGSLFSMQRMVWNFSPQETNLHQAHKTVTVVTESLSQQESLKESD